MSGGPSPHASAKDSVLGGPILKFLTRLPEKVRSALMIEDVATSCRHCRGAVRRPNEFCSQYCVLKYWERLRNENAKVSGTKCLVLVLVWTSLFMIHILPEFRQMAVFHAWLWQTLLGRE